MTSVSVWRLGLIPDYADEGLHTHTGRGAAYNAQMAGAIRAAGLPVEFITPSEYERV